MKLDGKVIHGGLEEVFLYGSVLYNLRGTSGFDGRTGFDLNTSRVFPQGALTAITLLGDGSELKGLGPEPGVSQCFFLFAQ